MKSIVGTVCFSVSVAVSGAVFGQSTESEAPKKAVKNGQPAKPGTPPTPIKGVVREPSKDEPLKLHYQR
jgi:hypothetical protein